MTEYDLRIRAAARKALRVEIARILSPTGKNPQLWISDERIDLIIGLMLREVAKATHETTN